MTPNIIPFPKPAPVGLWAILIENRSGQYRVWRCASKKSAGLSAVDNALLGEFPTFQSAMAVAYRFAAAWSLRIVDRRTTPQRRRS